MVAAPRFFATPDRFRAWLVKNHESAAELWVGFHKKATGKPSITWPESVDQALCFGWIDGVRKTIDETSYMIRFSPRRSRSIWSDINTRRAKELLDQGLMYPAGERAFAQRRDSHSGVYSFEQQTVPVFDADGRPVPGQSCGVELLRVGHALLPQDGHLVGDQREARRDQGPPPRPTHRRLRAQPADRPPHPPDGSQGRHLTVMPALPRCGLCS